MLQDLTYFRSNALEQLRHDVDTNAEKYSDEADWSEAFDSEPYTRTSRSIKIPAGLAGMVELPDGAKLKDAENSLIIYNAMAGLAPDAATDERIWAYLSHFDLQDYVRARWLAEGVTPKKIRYHFFASGIRGITRDNGVARLWWMGHVATKVAELGGYKPERVLEVLLHRSDVRSSLLERTSSATNLNILAAVFGLLDESYEQEGQELFERSVFRSLMKGVNALGGVLVLDALPIDALRSRFKSLVSG